MLAHIWPPSEATSIWSEIIEQRKHELASVDSNDPLRLSDIMMVRLEVTRDDLAKWNASARAWLDIADTVMKKEQTQFLLLVDRTRLLVDLGQGVYTSVMAAWKTALTTIENILNGMSYDVQNGAVLLGLASWHLFPDMHLYVGDDYKLVKQNDSLLQHAGVLTFGIEGQLPDDDYDGVRWTLPVAHLRYYGDPVQQKRSLGSSSVRLTIAEFNLVILGSLLLAGVAMGTTQQVHAD